MQIFLVLCFEFVVYSII